MASLRPSEWKLRSVGARLSQPVKIALTLVDMHHLFGDVTRSMLSCNRTRPIADDFLQSLHSHQLLLTSLIPHLNPPVPPEKSQVALPVDDAPQVVHSWQPSLDLFQDGSSSERIRPYIPNHFPEFPSKHTYKATPELPSAKADPRKVRELATEEARLGEAALRKLVGARSDMNTSTSVSSGQGFKSMRAKRDEAWKEAMQSVTLISNDEADFNDVMQGLDSPRPNARYEGAEATSNGYLSSSVNADKRYWRRPAPRRMPKDSTNIVAPWGL